MPQKYSRSASQIFFDACSFGLNLEDSSGDAKGVPAFSKLNQSIIMIHYNMIVHIVVGD